MTNTICERISHPLAIVGFGQEGRALLNLFLTHCPHLATDILSEDPVDPSVKDRYGDRERVAFINGKDCLKKLPEYAHVFRSPGVSIYKDALVRAKRQGVHITSSAQLWHDLYPRDTKIIVTGTKGKSTTSALLHCVLTGCGKDAALAGNIGIPLADLIVPGGSRGYWVVEMSSYQLSDFSGEPELAVLTSLYPDHMDWHRGIGNYFRDKTRLFSRLQKGRAVLNRRDGNTGKWVTNTGNAIYFNDPDGFYATCEGISYRGRHIISKSEPKLAGKHNLSNICAVLSVANALGIHWEEAIPHIKDFRGLPHRMEIVDNRDGIVYVNDSIATIPEAAMSAIEAFLPRPITLIIGGYDRGRDWSGLCAWLAQSAVRAVIGLPESGRIIVDCVNRINGHSRGRVSGFHVAGMEEALDLSRRITPKGGVVLLSPASPSYNMYKDYRERGEHFRTLVG